MEIAAPKMILHSWTKRLPTDQNEFCHYRLHTLDSDRPAHWDSEFKFHLLAVIRVKMFYPLNIILVIMDEL